MDPLLISSSLEKKLSYDFQWNEYSDRLRPSMSLKESPEDLNPNLSLVDNELSKLQEELYSSIQEYPIEWKFKTIFNNMDPFRSMLSYSQQEKNGSYYSLKALSLRTGIFPQGSKIFINDVRAIKFLEEQNLDVYYLEFVNTENTSIEVSSDEKIVKDFMNLNPTSSFRHTNIKMNNFEWDGLSEIEEIQNCQGIILRESSEGRDNNPNLRRRGPFVDDNDQYYNQEHFESSLYALEQLEDKGNALVQLISLGSQNAAEFIYIYSHLFEKIEVYMPMSSDFLSMEHYLVGYNFKKEYYTEHIDKFIDLSESYQASPENSYYPRITNFEKDENFMAWLFDLNNKMFTYHLSLVMALKQNLEDHFVGRYHNSLFPYALDPYLLKINLGLLDNNEKSDLGVFEEIKDFNLSEIEKVTSTGQIEKGRNYPMELRMEKLTYSACLYLSFLETIDRIHNYFPNFSRSHSKIPSWLINLQYQGRLKNIFSAQSQEKMREFYLKWTVSDLFSIRENLGEEIKLELLDDIFTFCRNRTIHYMTNGESIAKSMNFKIIKTKLLKYKVNLYINDSCFYLKDTYGSSFYITMKQLLGVIPVSYKEKEGISINDLNVWIRDSNFGLRLFNYLAFSIFSVSYSNNVSFFDLYNSHDIDFDFFGSPWSHQGLYWASYWQENQELGALSEDEAYKADSEFYQKHPEIKTFLFFPPQEESIFNNYLGKLKNFLGARFLQGMKTKIILVIENKSEHEDSLNDFLEQDYEINPKIFGYNRAYSTVTSQIQENQAYKIYEFEIL